MEQKFLSLYSSLTEEEQFQIGHALGDLVKSCTFRGFDCMGMDEDTFDHEVHSTKSLDSVEDFTNVQRADSPFYKFIKFTPWPLSGGA